MTDTTQPTIVISAARLDHIATLAELGRTTFLETFETENDPADIDAYVREAFAPETLRAQYETEGCQFYLLIVEGDPAGYLKLNMSGAKNNSTDDDLMEIERIYLLARFQRRGLGQRLLDFATKVAQERNCRGLWLGVWERNAKAIAFYEQAGFSIVGEQRFSIGTDLQLDLVMQRNF